MEFSRSKSESQCWRGLRGIADLISRPRWGQLSNGRSTSFPARKVYAQRKRRAYSLKARRELENDERPLFIRSLKNYISLKRLPRKILRHQK